MIEQSRTKNSVRNMVYGFGTQFMRIALSFVSRLIFIRILGEEILGISGLFTNILSVLSIAELGVSNAITFMMYKPLADKDYKKVSALLGYYRSIYNLIAFVILILGLSLIPFLDNLINLDRAIEHVYLYYILVLLNSVVSYLLVSRSAIIYADQKSYLLQFYQALFYFLNIGFSILFLFITKSYIVYLIIQVVFTLLNNLYSAYKAKKLYPMLDFSEVLSKEQKQEVLKNMKSMFIYKFGGVVLNNTDNIIISVLIGTIAVGHYSNYLLIITALNTILNILFTSFTASLGNLSATESSNKKYEVYKKLNFVSNMLLFTIISGLVFFTNDFIGIWLGNKFLLDFSTVLIIILNFYMANSLRIVSLYRDVTGLFNDIKYVFFITSLLNIILSFILGHYFGLFGILLATAISRLVTNYWYEPIKLFEKIFQQGILPYWKDKLIFILLLLCNYPILLLLMNLFNETGIIVLLIKATIVVLETIFVYILCFHRTEEFKYYKNLIIKRVKR